MAFAVRCFAFEIQPFSLWGWQLAGVAFSEDGVAPGAMGIDAGDYDHSGHPSLKAATRIDSLEVLWPKGKKQVLTELPINAVVTIHEERGAIR